MQQLSGIDQIFFSHDTPTTDAILGGLICFDAPEPGQPVPDEVFMRVRLSERLEYLPPLHMVRVRTPLGLDHDYLAEADRIDVAAHLRTVRLPDPGGDAELAAEISRIMATPLVPDRPLWDYTVFEGLAGGGVAHLFRVHHGVIDGGLLTQVWMTLSDTPGPLAHPDSKVTWPEPLGGRVELAARAVLGLAKKPLLAAQMQLEGVRWAVRRWPHDGLMTLPAAVAKLLPGELGRPVAALVNRRQRAVGHPDVTPAYPTLFPPQTGLNGQLSSKRHFVFVDLPFAETKAVGAPLGVTLNGVVVAAGAGAVRRYLQDRGTLPDKPLVLCCPISTRTGAEPEPWANYIDMMHVPFPTHLADPLERLRVASSDLTRAKTSFDGLPSAFNRDTSRLIPRDTFTVVNNLLVRLPNRIPRTLDNITISNVRGPAQVNRMNGLSVAGYYPVPFLTPGGGINLSLWSYRDQLCVGIMGCPDRTGELWGLAGYLREEVAVLAAAVAAVHGGPMSASQDRFVEDEYDHQPAGHDGTPDGGSRAS